MATRTTKFTVTTFTVEGRGAFPFDMLRYDCCWPKTDDDVHALHYNEGRSALGLRTVTLVTEHDNKPTLGRWNSYGWNVTSTETRKS